MARLKELYDREIAPALMKEFGYRNVMQIPRIEKVVINMGVGKAVADKNLLNGAVSDMTAISGQKPQVTKAKKSVAGFKLRQGQAIGCCVTLRRVRMYEFLDRLINVALPRTRDFQGVKGNSFDGRGNYCMGLKEQIIFPEIDYDKVDSVRGMDIVIVTSAPTDKEAKALLRAFRMPFKN
ncbi:MAG: 50S ribosomal protein L5 [Magnetococcales bacterium]|nr:50S ribosomal protein L5 [Magnetococcales bacterium]MBF0261683.1 50S ribosomal protein L5 [Magnetococcales bacterium]